LLLFFSTVLDPRASVHRRSGCLARVGSGNANFVFFQTIAITLCIIILVIEVVSSVRRLQSVAPGVMVLIGDVHGEWE